jgi:serine/threonine-protein kinase
MLEPIGGPIPIVEDVGMPSMSDSSTLVYIQGITGVDLLEERTLVWVDMDGKEQSISAQPNDYGGPRISPDGTQVALAVEKGQNEDIYIWDFTRKNETRLTRDEASDEAPLWTIDGKWIVFKSDREGAAGVYRKAADGAGETELVNTGSEGAIVPASWSDDGNTLVLTTQGPNFDVIALAMEGEREIKPLLQGEYAELQPQMSPDGQWIAYSSDESGEFEIYVRPFPEVSTRRIKVSTSGGYSPLWSPDGQKLFYRNGNTVMVVTVEREPSFGFGTPAILFSGTYAAPETGDLSRQTMWDIHPEGKRFLMIKPFGATDEESVAEDRPKIIVVTNWFEELKKLVPTK